MRPALPPLRRSAAQHAAAEGAHRGLRGDGAAAAVLSAVYGARAGLKPCRSAAAVKQLRFAAAASGARHRRGAAGQQVFAVCTVNTNCWNVISTRVSLLE